MEFFKETGEVVGIVLAIWIVQAVLHYTLGENDAVAGISLHKMLDIGHVAAVFNWVMGALLRLWP